MSNHRPHSNQELAGVTFTLLLALVSVNAIWGITSSEDTTISAWLRDIAPLPYWAATGFAAAGLYTVAGIWTKQRSRLGLGVMMFTYLVGVAVSRFAFQQIRPKGGIPFESQSDIFPALWERSFLLWPAIPMLAVYWLFFKKDSGQTLAWGQWRPNGSVDTSPSPRGDWRKYLLYFTLLIVLPIAVMMQAGVGFRPILNGNGLVFIGPLMALALFNAFSEELIFRGLFQPAFVERFGATVGIAMQGVFFGVHHWGASPDLIAELPTAIATCALGILWGYSVLATRGIAWAIITHALVDLAFFSAFFVNSD